MAPHTGDEVADDVFVFGGTDVNWVIVRDGADLTLVDAGWSGDTQAVERSIRSLGRRPEDVRAVLVTHAHDDHTGALNHLHDGYGVPVYLSDAEVPNALGTEVESAGPADMVRLLHRPQAVSWVARIVRAGALRHATTPGARPFPTDGPLDLPGHPVPVRTPGHTSGHTSYLLPSTGTVISGDALVSAHPTLRGTGPQLLPACFSHDEERAVDSLHVLGALEAEMFVPGHGPTWFGPISGAVDQALAGVGVRRGRGTGR